MGLFRKTPAQKFAKGFKKAFKPESVGQVAGVLTVSALIGAAAKALMPAPSATTTSSSQEEAELQSELFTVQ